MRSSKIIHVVSCHAAGEVGDVIVGGVAPPPGATLWEQSRFIAEDETLRNFMLNEPRGGVFRHVNLLVPPKNRLFERLSCEPLSPPKFAELLNKLDDNAPEALALKVTGTSKIAPVASILEDALLLEMLSPPPPERVT